MRKTGRHTSRLSSWGLYFSQNSDTIGTLYDFHKGHAGPVSPPAGRGRHVPHRHGRARPEDRGQGQGGRRHPQGVCGPHRGGGAGALGPEGLTRLAVFALVRALVNIALIIQLFEDLLHLSLVHRVGGADELVIGGVHQIPDALDLTGYVINEFLRCNTCFFCF